MEYCAVNWVNIVTVFLGAIFAVVLMKMRLKRKKYIFPPGPRGLPVVGNLIPLVKQPLHQKLSEWAYEYGDVYTIQLGPSTAIVVNDVAVMKDIFGMFPASTGKLLTDLFSLPFCGKYGILCVEGNTWAEQRQFCLKGLRNLGFGKGSTMEPMIIDEINDLVEWLQKECVNGRPVEILGMLQKATFNSLWTLVTGEKIPHGDTRFVDFMMGWLDGCQIATKSGLAFLPWLKYFAPEKTGYNKIYSVGTGINNFVREYFKEHENSFVEGSPRDLIDAYLEQMKKENDPQSSFYGPEGLKHSVGSVVTLFMAGGETTASTMNWLIFYLCCDQQVQRKLQEEIDRVIGRDREPCLKDRLNMPYAEAVILETMRKSTFMAIGLIHELTEETRFQKYVLPERTLLISNLYHVHYKKATWGDPEKFRPERFLNDNKNLRDNVVGFSVGKRQCLGEGLARDIMFMVTTRLFQKFHFGTDPNIAEKEYLEPDMGFCLATKHLPIVFTGRE